MPTAFGRFCRILRIENGEILYNMAQKLNVTAAYLSAVEIGKRNVPAGWAEIIAKEYSLNDEQILKLHEAIDSSVKQIKINMEKFSDQKRLAAAMFARKVGEMNDEDAQRLYNLLRG